MFTEEKWRLGLQNLSHLTWTHSELAVPTQWFLFQNTVTFNLTFHCLYVSAIDIRAQLLLGDLIIEKMSEFYHDVVHICLNIYFSYMSNLKRS